MERVPLEPLLWANGLLLLSGAVLTVLLLRWLVQRGEFSRPLGGATLPAGAPSPIPVIFALGLFLLSGIIPGVLLKPERFQAPPGSNEWYVATSVALSVRTLLAIGGCVLLMRMPRIARPDLSLGQQWSLVVVIGLVSLAVCTSQAEFFKFLWERWQPDQPAPQHAVLEALQANAWGVRGEIVLALGAVLVAPLFEEVIFRGLLLRGLWQMSGGTNPWPAVLFSGVLFGLIHYPQPQVVPPLIAFGIILGMVQVRTQRLWIVVGIHALFNLRTMATVLLNPKVLELGF